MLMRKLSNLNGVSRLEGSKMLLIFWVWWFSSGYKGEFPCFKKIHTAFKWSSVILSSGQEKEYILIYI